MLPHSQKVVTGVKLELWTTQCAGPSRCAPWWFSKGSSVLHQTQDALALVLGYFFRSMLSQLPLSQLRCQLPSAAHLCFPVKMDRSKRCGFFQCRQENLAAHRLTNSWANSLYHVQMWRCWKNIRVTVGSLMRTCLWSLLGENQADLFRKMMSGLLGGLTSTLAVRQGSFGELFGWQIAQIRWHFFSVWVTVCWLAIWLCSNGWAALTSRPFCFEAHIASLGVKWQELYEQRRELANNFKMNKCINFAESYVF